MARQLSLWEEPQSSQTALPQSPSAAEVKSTSAPAAVTQGTVLMIVAAKENSILFVAAKDLEQRLGGALRVIRPESRDVVVQAVAELPKEDSKIILVVDVDWGYAEFLPMACTIAQRLKGLHPVVFVFGLKAKGERLYEELKQTWRTGAFQWCDKSRKPGRKTLVRLPRNMPKNKFWAAIYDCVRPTLEQIVSSVSKKGS